MTGGDSPRPRLGAVSAGTPAQGCSCLAMGPTWGSGGRTCRGFGSTAGSPEPRWEMDLASWTLHQCQCWSEIQSCHVQQFFFYPGLQQSTFVKDHVLLIKRLLDDSQLNYIMHRLFALCGAHETTAARHREDLGLCPAAHVLTGNRVNLRDENSRKNRDCQEKPLGLWLIQ